MFRLTRGTARFIFVFLPVIFIISGLIGVCIKLSVMGIKDLNVISSRLLTDYTGQEVSVGKINIRWFDRLSVKDIEIKDPKEHKTILKADSLKLNFSLKSLRDRDYESSIQNISINNPTVNIKINPDGTTNLDFIKNLSKKDKEPKKPSQLKTVININNSRIEINDNKNNINEYVSKFDARIDTQKESIISINARLQSKSLKKTYIVCDFNMLNKDLSLDFKTDGIDFVELNRNILPDEYKSLGLKGTGKGYFGVKTNLNNPFEYKNIAFQMRFSDLSGKYKDFNLERADIFLNCRNNYATYSGSMILNGYELSSKGDGFLNKKDILSSDTSVKFSVKNGDLSKLHTFIKNKKSLPKTLEGIFSGEIAVNGTLNSPQILLRGSLNNAEINKLKIDDAVLNARLQEKKLVFKGKLSSKEVPNLYVEGFADNIDIYKFDFKSVNINSRGYAKIPDISAFVPKNESNIYAPKGALETEFQISGTGNNPKILANTKIYNGFLRFKEKEISDVTITSPLKFSRDEGLVIEKAVIHNFFDTDIFISTKIKDINDITLNVFLPNLDVKKLTETLDIENADDLSANISFLGTVKLRNKDIYVYGDTEIYEIRYKDYDIDFVKCLFAMKNDFAEVKNLSVLSSPTTLTYSGFADNIFSRKVDFKGDIKISNADLEALVEKMNIKKKKETPNKGLKGLSASGIKDVSKTQVPLNMELVTSQDKENGESENIPVSGSFDGNFSASGEIDLRDFAHIKVNDLYGAGKIEMTDFIIDKYPFDYASADFSLSGDMVYLDNLSGRASNLSFQNEDRETTITSSGSLNIKTQEINGNINIANVNVSDFQDYLRDFGYISGSGSIDCNISGTVGKINATANGSIRRVNMNGKSYRNVSIYANLYESKDLDLDIKMSRNSQDLSIFLKDYDIENRNIGSLKVSTLNISAVDLLELFTMSGIGAKEPVRNVLNKLPILTGGTLNFNLELSGALDTLSGSGELTGGNISFGSEIINDLTVKLELDKGIINMPELVINFPEIVITADAHPLLDKSNQTNINMSAINVPLGNLASYTPVKGIKGTLALDSLIKGDIKSPDITLSADIQDFGFGGINLKRITASKISINKDKIDLNSGIYIMIGDHYADVKGTIPLDEKNYKIAKDRDIDLSFSMEDQNAAFLSDLFPGIIKNTTAGDFDSRITLTGTINNPVLDGYASIFDGKIDSVGEISVNNVDAYLTLKNLEDSRGFRVNVDYFTASDNKSKEKSFEIKENSYMDFQDMDNSFVSAVLVLDNYYLTLKNLTSMKEDISGTLDGHISISGNMKNPFITDNGVPLKISGLKYAFSTPEKEGEQVTTEDGIYVSDSTKSAKEKKNFFINPTFDLKAEAKNAYGYPPFTKVKANTTASLSGSLSNPDFLWEASAVEGRVLLQVARLRINKGSSIKWAYKNHEPTSYIDASGFTDVRTTNKLGISNSYRVTVSVTGSFADYKLITTSYPEGLDDQQILSAIGRFGVVQGELGNDSYQLNLTDMVANVGISTLMSPIEDFFIETVGLDTFTVDYKNNEYALITMEKSFSKNFFISFYTNLYDRPDLYEKTNISSWGVSAGTRLWKWYRLTLGIDEQDPIRADLSISFAF